MWPDGGTIPGTAGGKLALLALLVSVCVNLGLLGLFKYSNFLIYFRF